MADQLDINRLTAFDASGDPLSGAKAYFFQSGTSTPITVYSDSALSVAHPSPLVADSAGVFAAVFYGAAPAVKVRVDTSADVEVYTSDPVRRVSGEGAAASSVSFAPTTEIPFDNVQDAIERVQANALITFNVIEKTSDYTVVSTNKTQLIRCTAALTLDLTAAATLGDGFVFGVQADGGDVVIDPSGSETVNGSATVTVPNGRFATIYCNGYDFFGFFGDGVDLDAAAQRALLGFGDNYIVQVARAETNTLTTVPGTGFPLDDTIPQNTEGTELLTLSITPTSATNKLRIRAVVHAGKSTGVDMMTGLFQDTTSDALAAMVLEAQSSISPSTMVLDHYMPAGTTSATTFKIRVGSTATIYVNGRSGARLFGGAMVSSLTIEEIKA